MVMPHLGLYNRLLRSCALYTVPVSVMNLHVGKERDNVQ